MSLTGRAGVPLYARMYFTHVAHRHYTNDLVVNTIVTSVVDHNYKQCVVLVLPAHMDATVRVDTLLLQNTTFLIRLTF